MGGGPQGQHLGAREAVGDQALGDEAGPGPDDVALAEAERAGDRDIGPERAAGAIGGEVQEEEHRDLLEAQVAEVLAQPMVDPGEVGGGVRTRVGSTGSTAVGGSRMGQAPSRQHPPLLWGGASGTLERLRVEAAARWISGS
jgi:hypothetical protein